MQPLTVLEKSNSWPHHHGYPVSQPTKPKGFPIPPAALSHRSMLHLCSASHVKGCSRPMQKVLDPFRINALAKLNFKLTWKGWVPVHDIFGHTQKRSTFHGGCLHIWNVKTIQETWCQSGWRRTCAQRWRLGNLALWMMCNVRWENLLWMASYSWICYKNGDFSKLCYFTKG